jgi:2',3'-cyclic-nucleotide 2'-phosphodiesterase (5'-nucleotidase family)
MKKLLLLSSLFLSLAAEARLLQIIHTNDLHSFFKGYKDGRGGYAKLKSKIEELKIEAKAKGVEVLHLDAGDFGEGTSFFLTQEGSLSVKALGLLGTDVAVIGNHDHMLGGRVLGEQIRNAKVDTKFVSANLVQTSEMNLKDVVIPFVDLKKAETKIRVIGLSTPEPHFQYPLLPGFILPAVQIGEAQSNEARRAGVELVIALTHIGKKADVDLAKKTSEVDLIVGGHSHERIENVLYVKNKKGKQVPIVQTGAHGLAVGALLIDIEGPGAFKIIDYKLHDIQIDQSEDTTLQSLVSFAEEERNRYFSGRWNEIIGSTLIPLSGYRNGVEPSGSSCWGEHMAKMSQLSTGADIALHLAQFEGLAVDPGPITFGDMIENFPHFRNYGDPGWEISTITVNGKTLKILLKAIINLQHLGINFYGVKYRAFKLPDFIPYVGASTFAYGFRVGGKKIVDSQKYKIAFPSEVGYAVKLSLSDVARKLMPDLTNTGVYYWKVMEDYIRMNSPISCLQEKSVLILTPDN